jgi:serine phosphatase RsbU (regulator of sigma subunit)
MKDSKITKKHHPAGSFARRILAISILLLVIPLFLQSLFLYKQEYDQKLSDVQADLKLLSSERAHLIEETLQRDWDFLEAEQGRVAGGRDVKRLYIQRIPLPQNVPNRFVMVSRSRDALLAGIAESNTSALVISIPLGGIAKDLPRAYPVRISLIDPMGKTLWENRTFKDPSELLTATDSIAETKLTVQLQVEKSRIQGLHLQSYYFRFATLVFFVGIIGGGAVYFFTRRIGKPLKNLCRTMERVSNGAAHARYTPDRMGFEINAIGLQFNETLDALLHHAQEAERERLIRERLAGELRIGHEIQASLLPLHVPGLPGVDIAAGYYASKEVNGDFYDLFRLEDGQILIAMCDTAGKGISACLFSLGLRSILRSFASVVSDLSELVRRANDLYLIDAHESSMFSTVWLGLYNPATQKLSYCSQGHPPAVLLRGSDLTELWTPGIALGAQKVDRVETKEISLMPGDILVSYTDGVIEAHDLDNELFGKGRLYELIQRKRNATSQQIADRIIEDVHLFSQGAPQHDDITLLVCRFLNMSVENKF